MKQLPLLLLAAALMWPLPAIAQDDTTHLLYSPPDVASTQAARSDLLSITGPTEAIEPNEDAWLQVANLTLDEIKSAQADGLFELTVYPSLNAQAFAAYDLLHKQPDDTLGVLFEAKYPADYLVKIHIVRGGKLESASIVVIVDGDGPKPDPNPDPGPDPEPVHATWAVIVEERSERTHLPANQRLIFESQVVRELLPSGQFTLYDRHSTDPAAKPYIDQAVTMSLPVLFLVTDDGTVAFSGRLPATVDETTSLIRAHGGGR